MLSTSLPPKYPNHDTTPRDGETARQRAGRGGAAGGGRHGHLRAVGWSAVKKRGRGWVLPVASGAKSNARFMRKLSLDRAKHTPHDPNRAALGGEFTSGLATRPASRAQGPHRTPTSRHFSYMPTRARLTTRTKPAIARPERTTNTRDTWPSSAAQLRAPPRLPHFNFLLSVVRRREPPARAASRSTEDRESRSALLAPADDRDAQPAPRSRPVKPRTREQEPRSPPPNDRAPSLVHEIL